ncbi:VOC family protein [Altererythrobacter sp. MF3-039]|uniref:VOC family protein n=1 Tax=Altererythrobacter sp. MF3-039 TaxID=3252901 RepID=UPI00390C4EB2
MMLRTATLAVLGSMLAACVQYAPEASAPVAAAPAEDTRRIVQSDFFRPESLGDTRIKGVRHIGKTVSNIDETLAFYQPAVPFELAARYRIDASELFHAEMMDGDHGEIEIALIRTPTVFLQLVDFDPDSAAEPYAKPVYGPGYTHICFQSPATAPAFGRFLDQGLTLVSRNAPVDLGGYGVTYAYGRDPDGTMIENETMDSPRREDSAWITHIGGATSNVDRMVEFYTKFIGYGARRRGEYSNFPRMDDVAGLNGMVVRSSWFVLRNLEIEFWEYIEPATPVRDEPANVDQLGYNMTAFEVTDADAEAARLEALGIAMLGPAIESHGWKLYYAYDPDGNVISIQENISAQSSESIDDMMWIDPTTY